MKILNVVMKSDCNKGGFRQFDIRIKAAVSYNDNISSVELCKAVVDKYCPNKDHRSLNDVFDTIFAFINANGLQKTKASDVIALICLMAKLNDVTIEQQIETFRNKFRNGING